VDLQAVIVFRNLRNHFLLSSFAHLASRLLARGKE
jgi:hypothetical protein